MLAILLPRLGAPRPLLDPDCCEPEDCCGGTCCPDGCDSGCCAA